MLLYFRWFSNQYPSIPEWYHSIVAFTVRTDQELEEALTSLAQVEGASRQEVVRRAVLYRYEQLAHEGDVADSMTRMTARWGDVLERLRTE